MQISPELEFTYNLIKDLKVLIPVQEPELYFTENTWNYTLAFKLLLNIKFWKVNIRLKLTKL